MTNEQEIAILEILEHNAQVSPAEIAALVGLTAEEVEAAIQRFEEAKVIRGYGALVDWDRLGTDRIYAFIDVRVRPQHDVGFDAIGQEIALFDEVHSLYLMSGQHDFLVVVEGRTLREVATFVAEKLAPLQGVESTATSFVLKKYKLEGQILGEEGEDWRLPVAP